MIAPNRKSKYIRRDDNFIAVDTEGTGLFPHHGCRAFAISSCDHSGDMNYWDARVNPFTRSVTWNPTLVRDIFEYILSYPVLVFHNFGYDFQILLKLIEDTKLTKKQRSNIITELHDREIHDTVIRTHLFDSKAPRGLKDQALLHCDILDDDEKILDDIIKHIRLTYAKQNQWLLAQEGVEELAGQKNKFYKCDFWMAKEYAYALDLPPEDIHWRVCETYARRDALRTASLFVVQENTFESYPQFQKPYAIQKDLLFPLLRMSQQGIRLHDTKFDVELEEAKNIQKSHLRNMRIQLKDLSFNPKSHPQLKEALFDTFKFTPPKITAKGQASTDKTALPLLLLQKNSKPATRFVESLLAYREVSSAVSYMESYKRFQIDGYLYPSLNQCGTSTTRLSSSNPNGQNIGKGKEYTDEEGNTLIRYSIRRVFGPRKGQNWVSIDYDQLQLRIFAYWSKEKSLMDAFVKGFDFHTYMAMLIFETNEPTKIQRRTAKAINFGYIFGAGEAKIDATAGIKGIFRRVQRLFPNVTEQINRTVAFVKQYGYIETASGYRLKVDKRKAYAGVNYIVQGTEGDIVKSALIDCDEFIYKALFLSNDPISNYIKQVKQSRDLFNEFNKFRIATSIILQVHDELLFSIPSLQDNLEAGVHVLNTLALIMEKAGDKFGVPCKCKPEVIEDNWAEARKLDSYLGIAV